MTLQRRGRLERRSALPRRRLVAKERDTDLDIPAPTRALLRARSAGRCEAALFHAGCTQAATDAHHRKRRRDGGHAITNLVDLCRECHRWAHDHPADARALGLIVSAFEDPADVPVRLLSRLVGARVPTYLTADGGYVTDLEELTHR